ncbi:iron-siderophore ABC transporter substrate-binding protein [Rhodococcus sp. X156]|uniref:iron-siderophore ABC transporter substrate-binding protein n=1 Tax=Rhodococcus sp. X156 TaxID=2499145 RepID=UPI000FD7D898|nr:iron-siderophore ABC transporter substrate-binding protein [Rhodococcus sp. X156]
MSLWSRTRAIAAVSVVLGLALAGCSTGTSDDSAATEPTTSSSTAYPVTIKHSFGETTLAKQPTRVATVSWVNADVALALGVVPVGMSKDEFGGNDKGSTPWKDEALKKAGAEIGTSKAPAQYSETDGINFTEVAKAQPDVILAAYSGITQEEYDKLSKIAPVIAPPGVAYGTSWQDSAKMIGQALGKSSEADTLIADNEKLIAEKVAQYPQLKGKTFIYGNLDPSAAEKIYLYTDVDNRPRFLSSLGMTLAPVVAQNAKGEEFYVSWSPERADQLAADVFVSWVADAKTVDTIKADPLLSQIPAVKNGALVTTSDNTLTLSLSAASVLSIPWALDQYLPLLADAAGKAS